MSDSLPPPAPPSSASSSSSHHRRRGRPGTPIPPPSPPPPNPPLRGAAGGGGGSNTSSPYHPHSGGGVVSSDLSPHTGPPPALFYSDEEGEQEDDGSNSRNRMYGPPSLPQSPASQARKLLAERGALLLSATMDEDDDEAALYTEVVLSDDEMVETYTEPDDDDDEDDEADTDVEENRAAGVSSIEVFQYNRRAGEEVSSHTATPVSSNLKANRPSVRRTQSGRKARPPSLDSMDDILNAGAVSNEEEEEDFRIRRWLGHSSSAQPPAAIPPPPAGGGEDGLASPPALRPSPPWQRSGKNHLDALFVEDKPWRSNRPSHSPKRKKPITAPHSQPPQPQAVASAPPLQPKEPPQQHRGSILGYLRNKLPGKKSDAAAAASSSVQPTGEFSDEDGVEPNLNAEASFQPAKPSSKPGTPIKNRRTRSFGDVVPASAYTPQQQQQQTQEDIGKEEDSLEGHDLIVEAASSLSSFGDNNQNESEQDEWEEFMLDDEDEDDEYFGWERPVEWKRLAEYKFPTQFCRPLPPLAGGESTTSSKNKVTSPNFSLRRASHFVWQHGMLLHAALQLLMERDHLGDEGSTDALDNIWKKGPLKKMTTGKGPSKWKVKYVEVRRGNLCYYEDSGVETGRKIIHLRSSDTSIHARLEPPTAKQSSLYVFEMVKSGYPRFVWAARSDEERQAWIRTIQAAMLGQGITHEDESNDAIADLQRNFVAQHQEGIDRYTALRLKLKKFDLHEDYESAVQNALFSGEAPSGSGRSWPLQIPVSWIRQQVQDLGGKSSANKSPAQNIKNGANRMKSGLTASGTDPQKQIRSSIAEFWNNMKETAFAVNGLVISRDMPFCAERVFGSLTRCIMEFDRAFANSKSMNDGPGGLGPSHNSDTSAATVTELQAVSYARDILVAVLKTREQYDVLYAVNDLFRNDDLVVVSAKEDESVVYLEVSFAGDDWKDYEQPEMNVTDKTISQWLHTKKRSVGWRRRFAVLSGVVLSYYESASPRPHGLKAQTVLDRSSVVATQPEIDRSNSGNSNPKATTTETDASKEPQQQTNNNRRHVLIFSTKNENRLLSFESEAEMVEWQVALQNAIDSCAVVAPDTKHDEISPPNQPPTEPGNNQGSEPINNGKKKFRVIGSRAIKSGGKKVLNRAKVVFGKSFRHQHQHADRNEGTPENTNNENGDAEHEEDDEDEIQEGEEEEEREREPAPYVDIPRRRPSVHALMDNTMATQQGVGKREQSVQCVVQHFHRFVIRDRYNSPNKPGTADEDCLLTVSAKLFQAFMISGGANGRLSRGNALVEIDIAGDKRDGHILRKVHRADCV